MTFKEFIKKLLHRDKMSFQPGVRDFSLNSGERQTGSSIDEIRADHKNRYSQSIEMLTKQYQISDDLFGLDIFCANGYGTSMLSDALRCSVMGIDASQEAIDQAQKFYPRVTTLYCCKMFPFALPHDTFDFITCIESIEHTSHYEQLVYSMVSSLKSGGMLFVSTPNEEIMPFNVVDMPFHVKHFAHEELIELVQQSGSIKLIDYFAQDVYEYEDLVRKDLLPENKMSMREGEQGQFQLYAFEKL